MVIVFFLRMIASTNSPPNKIYQKISNVQPDNQATNQATSSKYPNNQQTETPASMELVVVSQPSLGDVQLRGLAGMFPPIPTWAPWWEIPNKPKYSGYLWVIIPKNP